MTDQETEREFLKEFMDFYKRFMESSSGAIEQLADIQEEYPDQYHLFQEVQHDPSEVLDATEEMSEEKKNMLLTLIVRASNLGQRTNNIFQMSSDEKRELSEDLTDFGEFVETQIEELSEEDSDE